MTLPKCSALAESALTKSAWYGFLTRSAEGEPLSVRRNYGSASVVERTRDVMRRAALDIST